jgi:hypothetical protein
VQILVVVPACAHLESCRRSTTTPAIDLIDLLFCVALRETVHSAGQVFSWPLSAIDTGMRE